MRRGVEGTLHGSVIERVKLSRYRHRTLEETDMVGTTEPRVVGSTVVDAHSSDCGERSSDMHRTTDPPRKFGGVEPRDQSRRVSHSPSCHTLPRVTPPKSRFS